MPDRIRILQLLDSLRLGGAQRLVLDLARRLDGERYKVQVCSIQGGHAFREGFSGAGIAHQSLGCRKYGLAAALRLQRLCAEFCPDIVHAHLLQAHVFGAWLRRRRAGLRLICHIHSRPIGFPWSVLQRWGLEQADAIVTVSARTKAAYQATLGLDLTSAVVIHNGVATDILRPGDRMVARQRLGISDEGFVIGYVGRLARVKGPDVLLDAMEYVWAEAPDVGLAFVGDGPMREEPLAASQEQPRLAFLGPRHDVPAILPAFDILCVPSRYETFGLAALEAMACGVPVIATSVGGVPEAIRHRETGLLVPSEDPRAMAGAILELLADRELRCSLAGAGAQSVREQFDIARTTQQIEELYRTLVAGGNGPPATQ